MQILLHLLTSQNQSFLFPSYTACTHTGMGHDYRQDKENRSGLKCHSPGVVLRLPWPGQSFLEPLHNPAYGPGPHFRPQLTNKSVACFGIGNILGE